MCGHKCFELTNSHPVLAAGGGQLPRKVFGSLVKLREVELLLVSVRVVAHLTRTDEHVMPALAAGKAGEEAMARDSAIGMNSVALKCLAYRTMHSLS